MNLSLCDNSSSVGMEYARCLEEAEEDIAYSICPDLALCNTSHSGDNVGLAFGLTIGAGLATTLGALLPFIPCIKLTNTRILSAGLAVAAGVMIYVSFAEIWKKSRDNFCCVTPEHFDTAVTACFFGGILITVLLDLVVGGLQRLECGVCCCCCPTQRKRGVACLLFCCKQRNGKGTISATNRVVERAGDNASQNGVIAMTHLDATTVAPSDADTALSLGGDEGQCQSNTDSSGERQSCDGLAITDGASVAGSENTNHYATVSINDLFSNSSLLRMNAVINEPTSLSLAEVGEEKEGGDSTLAVGGRGCASPCIERVSADSSQVLGPAELKEITEILGKNTKQLHRMGILTGEEYWLHCLNHSLPLPPLPPPPSSSPFLLPSLPHPPPSPQVWLLPFTTSLRAWRRLWQHCLPRHWVWLWLLP